ncbi:hypothetical protein RSJ68_08815 [Neisseria sp. DTU_2020_1000833_1_SI_GRL_NUU_006]|nr:hypothetical protein RSJ68_08815 [Neisseria sp. DTU_2020_1000833_1_SI_GRL_NUU_006]
MGISVEKFITEQEEKGRRSKLEPFKSDILLLKQKGFSQKQIQQFLKENGLEVGLTTINWFVKTRLRTEQSNQPENSKTEAQKPPSSLNHLKENERQKTENPDQSSSGKSGEHKFDWQNQINPKEYI